MARVIVSGDSDAALDIHGWIQYHLSGVEHDVLFSPNPGELIANIRKVAPDLIILDFEILATNPEVSRRVGQLPGGSEIPILAVNRDEATGTASEDDGIDSRLSTPVTPKALIPRAARLLGMAIPLKENIPERSSKRPPPQPVTGAATKKPTLRKSITAKSEKKLEGVQFTRKSDRVRDETVFTIPEGVRKHFFYHSDTVQGILDAVEDNPAIRKLHSTVRGGKKPGKPAGKAVRPPSGQRTEGVDPKANATDADRTVAGVGLRGRTDTRNSTRARVRKITGVIILLGTIALAGGIAYGTYRLLMGMLASDETQTSGMAVMICTECDWEEEKIIDDIHSQKCLKCSAPLGLAMQCLECETKFGYLPPDPAKSDGPSPPQCPECESFKIRPILPTEEEQ